MPKSFPDMPILQNIRSCVRRKHGISRKPTKVYFNVRILDAFKSENIASQLRDLLVYIAREGVAVTDLFRRPGNPQCIKKIISDLESGRRIAWTDYSFYTLANIAKRFLLHINGGLLGAAMENALIDAMDIEDIDARYSAMNAIITSQPKTVQQLLALLFGTWFRMIYHTEVNAMSVEAVAKSVAGSIFPSTTYSPERVEKASKVMEILILGFASTQLFGRELIEYFTQETKTSISRVEKFKYEFRFSKDMSRERSRKLFMQILLDEGRRHGFDVVNDEVSQQVFEETRVSPSCDGGTSATAEWIGNCPFDLEERRRSTSAAFYENGNQPDDPYSCSSGLRGPLLTLYPCLHKNPSTNSIQMMFKSQLKEDGTEFESPHQNSVQQYSEKRTCFTATPDLRYYQAEELGHKSVLQTNTFVENSLICNSASDMGDLSSANFNASFMNPVSQTDAGCFNSVKRRQLQRLQRRSDWFLSPPAGLRNSGMIRVDVCGDENYTPYTLSQPPNNYPDHRKPSDESESSEHFTTVPEPSSLNVQNKSNTHLDNRNRTSINSCQSPLNSSEFRSNVVPLGLTCDDADNLLLETRYFVVERYYGPESNRCPNKPTTLPFPPQFELQDFSDS